MQKILFTVGILTLCYGSVLITSVPSPTVRYLSFAVMLMFQLRMSQLLWRLAIASAIKDLGKISRHLARREAHLEAIARETETTSLPGIPIPE